MTPLRPPKGGATLFITNNHGNGLQPKSDGLQPSDGPQRRFAAMASNLIAMDVVP